MTRQENTTLAKLDKSFSVYAPSITINTSIAVLLKPCKVVWHFRGLVFLSICPSRSDIIIWNGSLSASLRPDHMCGYNYLETQESDHLLTNCLSVFDHFVKLARKGLIYCFIEERPLNFTMWSSTLCNSSLETAFEKPLLKCRSLDKFWILCHSCRSLRFPKNGGF